MSGHPIDDPTGHPPASSTPLPSAQASVGHRPVSDTDSLRLASYPSIPHGCLSRVRIRHVEWVEQRLSPRDTDIIDTVGHLRLITGEQLGRLHFADLSPASRDRARRRVLHRLVSWRVLATLDRRVGGVRAGSAGLVYALDTAGTWLARLRAADHDTTTAPRRPSQPGAAFTAHILNVTTLYVELVEHARRQPFKIREFQAEPACWWPHPAGGWLKPDAYTLLATAGHRDAWWIEVDRATETLPRLRRKLLTYLDFAHHGGIGPAGVLPRVLITTPTPHRRQTVDDLITGLSPPADELFTVSQHHHAVNHLTTALHDQ